MTSVSRLSHVFDRPGVYEIHVAGSIDAAWAERLAGMTISPLLQSPSGNLPITVLTGWLPDQAALNGVLNTLYDLQHALVYVAVVETAQPEGADQLL